MNPAASQQIAELAALTKAYLLQECRPEEWLPVSKTDYLYFKELAQKQPAPKPIEATPPPAPAPIAYTPPPPVAKKIIEPVPTPAPTPIAAKPVPAPAIESPPAPKKIAAPHEFFIREPFPKTNPVDLSDIRQIVTEKFPHVVFIDQIPSPEAKPLPSILLLTLANDGETLDFLQKVGKAIQDRFGSAEVCSAQIYQTEPGWEKVISSPQMKLILLSDDDLDKLPDLKQYHRKLPQHGKQMLGSIRYIPLASAAAYQADPKLKSILWKAVCEHLQS